MFLSHGLYGPASTLSHVRASRMIGTCIILEWGVAAHDGYKLGKLVANVLKEPRQPPLNEVSNAQAKSQLPDTILRLVLRNESGAESVQRRQRPRKGHYQPAEFGARARTLPTRARLDRSQPSPSVYKRLNDAQQVCKGRCAPLGPWLSLSAGALF